MIQHTGKYEITTFSGNCKKFWGMRKHKSKEIVITVYGRKNRKKICSSLQKQGFEIGYYQHGFRCTKKNVSSAGEIRRLKRYCTRKGLRISVTSTNHARSSNYREAFIREYGQGPYRCAYCGKKITKTEMTVDHIIPVNRFKNDKGKVLMFLFGLDDINGLENLAPACRRCNERKGTSTGLWSLRGFLGKNKNLRIIMNITRDAIHITAICLCIALIAMLVTQY